MELCCPRCRARYRVASSLLRPPDDAGTAGDRAIHDRAIHRAAAPRRARCTACGTLFAIEPQNSAAEESANPAAIAARAAGEPSPDAGDEEPDAEEEPAVAGKPRRARRRMRAIAGLAIAVPGLALGAFFLARAIAPGAIPAIPMPAFATAGIARAAILVPELSLPRVPLPRITLPEIALPKISLPHIALPRPAPSPLIVSMDRKEQSILDGKAILTVAGAIRNPTAATLAIPPISLVFLDRRGETLQKRFVQARAKALAPGASTRFEGTIIEPPPGIAATIVRAEPPAFGRP